MISVPSVQLSRVDDSAVGAQDESKKETIVTVQLTADKKMGEKTVSLKDAMGGEVGSSPATAENVSASKVSLPLHAGVHKYNVVF